MKKLLKRSFLALLVMGLAIVSNSAVAKFFSDVNSEMIFYSSIDYLSEEGIIVGYSDGSFGYDLNINRAELLKIVVEAKYVDGLPTELEEFSNDECFDDVPTGEWYTKYICYAKDNGWVDGYADGTFAPAQNINFVEAVKIVLEVFGVEYDETDTWYKGLVEAASAQNLIPLTIDKFDGIITRAEMVDMIVRKINYDEGTLDTFLGEKLADVVVTYDTISEGYDMTEVFIGCGGPDCEGSCTYNGLAYENGENVYKGKCTTCECVDGEIKYCTGLCVDEEVLYVDWGDDLVYTDMEKENYFYSNDLFLFSVLSDRFEEGDFQTVSVDPNDEEYLLDGYSSDSCEIDDTFHMDDFSKLTDNTKSLLSLKLPVFSDWNLTLFASKNPYSWTLEDAQAYASCSTGSMEPIMVIQGGDTAIDEDTIIWLDTCNNWKGNYWVQSPWCEDTIANIKDTIQEQFLLY